MAAKDTDKKVDTPFTYRGRELDKTFASPPVMGRQRANSLRRLNRDVLTGLAQRDGEVGIGATRELDVRTEMQRISASQVDPNIPSSGPQTEVPRMKARQGVNRGDVDALRFASSMAEEAQHEVRQFHDFDPTNAKGSGRSIPMVGIARVGGSRGFGISGEENGQQAAHSEEVQRRMLVLQGHYDEEQTSGNWSARLRGVPVQPVTAAGGGNVCAASRATAAAMAGNGHSPRGSSDREALPVPDALIELGNRSVGLSGGRMGGYAEEASTGRGIEKDVKVTGRSRAASTGNVMKSCQTCMDERTKHMPHKHE
jgi:hypothetical protein